MATSDDPAARSVDALRAAIAILDLRLEDLWLAYFGLGGNHAPGVVERWTQGAEALPPQDYAVLAVVANEALVDRGLDPSVPDTLHPAQ